MLDKAIISKATSTPMAANLKASVLCTIASSFEPHRGDGRTLAGICGKAVGRTRRKCGVDLRLVSSGGIPGEKMYTFPGD
jgi:hypothetical protein